jgi:hypothetical protein
LTVCASADFAHNRSVRGQNTAYSCLCFTVFLRPRLVSVRRSISRDLDLWAYQKHAVLVSAGGDALEECLHQVLQRQILIRARDIASAFTPEKSAPKRLNLGSNSGCIARSRECDAATGFSATDMVGPIALSGPSLDHRGTTAKSENVHARSEPLPVTRSFAVATWNPRRVP